MPNNKDPVLFSPEYDWANQNLSAPATKVEHRAVYDRPQMSMESKTDKSASQTYGLDKPYRISIRGSILK